MVSRRVEHPDPVLRLIMQHNRMQPVNVAVTDCVRDLAALDAIGVVVE